MTGKWGMRGARPGGKGSRLVALVVLLIASSGCGEELREADEVLPGPDAATPTTPPPLDLAGVPTAPVERFEGPGGESFEVTLRSTASAAHLQVRIGPEIYPLALRTEGLTLSSYPCASCHAGVTILPERQGEVHDDIPSVHPSESGHLCVTCHVADSVERLRLASGESVSLDHAYRLCGQCHATETRSWAGGIHGKRLEGWHGRRVVMNCADCHDPHTPSLEPRIPYPAPRIPRPGGEEE